MGKLLSLVPFKSVRLEHVQEGTRKFIQRNIILKLLDIDKICCTYS